VAAGLFTRNLKMIYTLCTTLSQCNTSIVRWKEKNIMGDKSKKGKNEKKKPKKDKKDKKES
jgi:hypothetical protein